MSDERNAHRCPMCDGELRAIDATGYSACQDCSYWEYGAGDEGPRLAADVPADDQDSDRYPPLSRFGSD
jgi:hypothetical protein